MAKVKPQLSPKTFKNNIDNIAGAGGGMLLLRLAQNLSEDNQYKSWLIILAPALTLFIKYLWNQCSPEVSFFIKRIRTNKARKRLIKEIDLLLTDGTISEEQKIRLREKKEQVRLSTVEGLIQHFESITAS